MLLNGPYSENKLNDLLGRMMNALTDGLAEDIITLKMFEKMFKKYDISSVENVRDYLLNEK